MIKFDEAVLLCSPTARNSVTTFGSSSVERVDRKKQTVVQLIEKVSNFLAKEIYVLHLPCTRKIAVFYIKIGVFLGDKYDKVYNSINFIAILYQSLFTLSCITPIILFFSVQRIFPFSRSLITRTTGINLS